MHQDIEKFLAFFNLIEVLQKGPSDPNVNQLPLVRGNKGIGGLLHTVVLEAISLRLFLVIGPAFTDAHPLDRNQQILLDGGNEIAADGLGG